MPPELRVIISVVAFVESRHRPTRQTLSSGQLAVLVGANHIVDGGVHNSSILQRGHE